MTAPAFNIIHFPDMLPIKNVDLCLSININLHSFYLHTQPEGSACYVDEQ